MAKLRKRPSSTQRLIDAPASHHTAAEKQTHDSA
jgi:hypothetical protein